MAQGNGVKVDARRLLVERVASSRCVNRSAPAGPPAVPGRPGPGGPSWGDPRAGGWMPGIRAPRGLRHQHRQYRPHPPHPPAPGRPARNSPWEFPGTMVSVAPSDFLADEQTVTALRRLLPPSKDHSFPHFEVLIPVKGRSGLPRDATVALCRTPRT